MGFFLVLCTLATLIIITTTGHGTVKQPEENQFGRIKAFDDLLLMYGEELDSAQKLEKLLEEMERLATNKKLIKEHTAYYIATLKKMMEKGSSKVLKQDQERLNNIITSASYQPDGDAEIQYALVRRNIIGAFIDSIASHYLALIESAPTEVRWCFGEFIELVFEKLKKMAVMAGKRDEHKLEEEL